VAKEKEVWFILNPVVHQGRLAYATTAIKDHQLGPLAGIAGIQVTQFTLAIV
jgi:hypothetical protein